MIYFLKRLPQLVKTYFSYHKGSEECLHYPLYLWIEPTNVCNFKCITCPTSHPSKRDSGFMDIELFRNIMEQAKDFSPVVYLHFSGEPLLHKQITEMVRITREYNGTSCLFTNASLLDEAMSKKLINAELDWLGFSFDGYNKASYETIRIGGNYEKTLENIFRFLEIKKLGKSKKPYTYLSNIEPEEIKKLYSEKERKDFKIKLLNSGLNCFHETQPHTWAGKIDGIEMKTPSENHNKKTLCPAPWTTLAIYHDGRVVPCCFDTDGEYVLGNVKESSLKEIWNSEQIKSLRRTMAEGQYDKINLCRLCHVPCDKRILTIPKAVWTEFFETIRMSLPGV